MSALTPPPGIVVRLGDVFRSEIKTVRDLGCNLDVKTESSAIDHGGTAYARITPGHTKRDSRPAHRGRARRRTGPQSHRGQAVLRAQDRHHRSAPRRDRPRHRHRAHRPDVKVCAEPGCPTLVEAAYCPKHKPPPRPGRPMPTNWPAIRRRIIARDRQVCRLKLEGCTGRATSVDHVIPASRGGTDDDSNLVACCWPCNKRKGNRMGGG